jgi:adenylosuccinate lyase
MATEEVLMSGVQAGGDRQELHERIRVHSQAAARQVKEQGAANDLLSRLAADPAFAKVDLTGALDPRRYFGRAPEQVDAYIANVVEPIRTKYLDDLGQGSEDVRV